MNINKYIIKVCKQAVLASKKSGVFTASQKNNVLKDIANNIESDINNIIKSNEIDIKNARRKKISDAMIDRLVINTERIASMCDGLNKIIKIPDTLYKIVNNKKQKSGITVSQMRVPLGVIAMIYESRPNVTIDAAGLCIKSGNSVILRGGSESIYTNKRLMVCITKALKKNRFDKNIVQLIETTDRKAVGELISMNKYIDVIIPRGGKSLIERIAMGSKIPVIKHLDGNCHIYIDKTADIKKAMSITINSKTQRYGVCNATESLLIHKSFPKIAVKDIVSKLKKLGVEIRGCKNLKKIDANIILAKENDWYEEFLAPIISIKIVNNLEDAIYHIEKYGSLHTDGIISSSKTAIDKFSKMVNSSSIMINTSTRFADGYEYGLGAEIGISTDKLHARGPVGLEGLTNLKYVVKSHGKLRH